MDIRLRSRFSTALLCQLALLAVFLALPVALWALQGDSTVVTPDEGNLSPLAGWFMLKGLGIPIIASWIFKQWNTTKERISKVTNPFVTSVIYIAASVVLGLLATAFGTMIGKDPMNWTTSTAATLVGSIVTTIAVMLGIETKKAKDAAAKASFSSR